MRDYTDRHHRRFTRLLSREAVLWSEMEKPGAILKAADASSVRKLDRLLQRGSDEGYEVFQIGGSDPVTVAAATSLVLPYGYDELNLNCGCPAITSGGGDYGASLMRRGGDDAARVVEAMVREAQKCDPRNAPKISVKCRVGIAETVGDVLPKHASKEEVRERLAKPLDAFVAKCADAGAASVVVHCRQAVMTGLSPSKNRGIPPLRPELVFELCSTRSTRHPNELEFILNGGVSSFADAANVFSSCPTLKGAQAGRWPLLRPFDMLHVDAFLTRVFDDAKGDDASLREEDLPTRRVSTTGPRKELLSLRLRPASRGARGGGGGDVRVSEPVVYGGSVVAKRKRRGRGGAAARARARGPRRPTRGGFADRYTY
jgi:tRNA-dihydrouridine synthase A